MNDGSRQNLSANIHGIGLNYRNSVLAGRNHRNTSCDGRSHKKRIRKGRPAGRPALVEDQVVWNTLSFSETDSLFA